MLAKSNFIQCSQDVAKISKVDLNGTIDSIFIIKSLLIALVKDFPPISRNTSIAVLELMQEITYLENKDSISDAEFFHIDTNFYVILTNMKGFRRLASIILKEKLRVDRTFRLFVKGKESYIPILRVYNAILCGIQSNHSESSLSALSELSELLKAKAISAKQNYPDFFLN